MSPSLQPADYETPEIAPSDQHHAVIEMLAGTHGTPQQIEAVRFAVGKLQPDLQPHDLKRGKVVAGLVEKLRRVFAHHADLWPIFYKREPHYPDPGDKDMFAEQKALAAEIAMHATKAGKATQMPAEPEPTASTPEHAA